MIAAPVSGVRRKGLTGESCSLTIVSGDAITAKMMAPHPVYGLLLPIS